MSIGDFDYLNKIKAEYHCCRKTENNEKIDHNEKGLAKRN